VPFKIKVNGKVFKYIADAVYEEDGKVVIDETKGMREGVPYNLWWIKWNLMQEQYPDFIYRIYP